MRYHWEDLDYCPMVRDRSLLEEYVVLTATHENLPNPIHVDVTVDHAMRYLCLRKTNANSKWHGIDVEGLREQIRALMQKRLNSPSRRSSKQDERCRRGIHRWYDRFNDGRDLACKCSHCGAHET